MFNESIQKVLDDFIKSEDSDRSDVEIYVFPQIWGSTALGYSGIGGQAMTSSHTIVFYNTYTGNVMLSYGGKFIRINTPNQEFFKDLFNNRIEPEYQLGKYKRN